MAHPPEDVIPGEIFGSQSIFSDYYTYYHDDPYYAYKATSDPDTIYFHEVIRLLDRYKFSEAMEKRCSSINTRIISNLSIAASYLKMQQYFHLCGSSTASVTLVQAKSRSVRLGLTLMEAA